MALNAVIGALRVNLGLDSAEFQDGVKGIKGQLGGITKMIGGIAAAGGFAALSVQIGQAIGRIEEARKLTAQFDQALKNTGNTADTSGKQLAEFADHIERQTGRAAEEILAVGTNLATFGFNHDVFYNAIELANDMAAAWGGDLRQNVEGLARALADPEKGLAMLTKRGITFTDQQKDMIAGFMKSNNLLGAQGVIMDALNEQVQGVAAAGFTGLTKAQANATKGIEDFFEGIAEGLQLNLGLELGLIAVANALTFVTENLGPIGKAAGVVGVAVMTALGPAVWGLISAAALSMGKAGVGAIRAIGVAIAANPIGAIIVALSAAVAAVFLFRDEIKQAIGVDVVGVIGDAVNAIIGGFVGGYEGIKAVWALLPSALGDLVYQGAQNSINGVIYLVREAQVTLRGFLGWVDMQLRKIGGGLDLSGFKLMDYADLNNPFAGAAGNAAAVFSDALEGAQGDYLGKFFGAFSGSLTQASAEVRGFGDLLEDTSVSGGAGLGKLTDKVGGLSGALTGAKNSLGELGQALSSGLAGIASGVTKAFLSTENAAQKALDVVLNGLEQIGSKAIDMAFNGIFDMIFGALGGAFGGNSLGGGWGIAGGFGRPGIFGVPGLATTGRVMKSGLVEVGERGREVVALPAGAQVMRHTDFDAPASGGGGDIYNIDARGAQRGVGEEIARHLAEFKKRDLPRRIQEINRNPHRR